MKKELALQSAQDLTEPFRAEDCVVLPKQTG